MPRALEPGLGEGEGRRGMGWVWRGGGVLQASKGEWKTALIKLGRKLSCVCARVFDPPSS